MSRLVSTSTRSMRFRWQIVSRPLVEPLHGAQDSRGGSGRAARQQLLGHLQPDELRHPLELEVQLVVVHDLEEHHLVAAVAHLLQGRLPAAAGR